MRSTPPSQSRTPSVALLCLLADIGKGGRRIIGFVLPTPDERFYNISLFFHVDSGQNQLQRVQAVGRSTI